MILKNIISEIDVWEDWRKNYSYYVPLFINEASNKQNWKDWDSEIFTEYFETSADQCVSSLKQGNFSNAEKDRIKTNWDSVGPLLKKIADSQDVPLFDVYDNFRTEILKHTDTNKEAAINRMVAGLQPNLLCTIIAYHHLNNLYNLFKQKLSIEIPHYKFNNWFTDSYEVCKFFKTERPDLDTYHLVTYPWQVLEYLRDNNKNIFPVIQNTMNENMKEINLLKYKKQIILQGPPGTGKTRLAKEIAAEMISLSNPSKSDFELSNEDIIEILKSISRLTSVAGNAEYEIANIDVQLEKVVLKKETGAEGETSFLRIKEGYKSKIWESSIVNNEDRRAAAIAKYIYENISEKHDIKNSSQFKIIQFHPSYSYEDFVRGIVAKPNENGEGILYDSENKILGNFAKLANQNYKDSKIIHVDETQTQFSELFDKFIDEVREAIDKDGEFILGDDTTAKIIGIVDGAFLYSFDKRKDIRYRLLFSDLLKIDSYYPKVKRTIDIRDMENGYLKMKGKHPYYFKVYSLIKSIHLEDFKGNKKTDLKNYVLIIDEINRANLSSVLGELIYALEYRGEDVDSMYEVDGSNKLILPDNLFIIGTMNTADRSVGHIDYAIRRRFAFVDVEPKDLSNDSSITFHKILFDAVSALFDSNHLSPEFEKKDVQLGHSYFIDKTKEGGSMDIRLEYEIKPILKEYVKDGILIGEDIKQIIEKLQA